MGADPYLLYGGYPYAYAGYGYPYAYGAYPYAYSSYRYLGKRSADSEPEAKADAEADSYLLYSGYPYAYAGYGYPYAYGAYPYAYSSYHYLGKRSAEAEPEAEPTYYYGRRYDTTVIQGTAIV